MVTNAPCICPTCPAGTGWQPDTSTVSGWAEYTDAVRTTALDVAISVIWAATGRQFGPCATTVRPCWSRPLPAYLTYPASWDPMAGDGQYAWGLVSSGGGVQLLGGCCGGTCACRPPEIPLPGPVLSVTAVTIAGTVLASSAYRLDGDHLVRQDGQAWPQTQDLSAVAGAADTWSVDYLIGQAVPTAANVAAGLYAGEVAGWLARKSCQLPQRVQSISRQGVSAQMISIEGWLEKGLTGVPVVDRIVRSLNPAALTHRPMVLSPDLPEFR